MRSTSLQFVLAVVLSLFVASVTPASAQSCPVQPESNRQQVWERGLELRVWFDPTFSAAQINEMMLQANAWGASQAAGMMGVTITFVTNPGAANVTVSRQNPDDPTDQAQINVGPDPYGTGAVNAAMRINPLVQNATATGLAFSHEFGHPFGLRDCWTCTAGSSSMAHDQMNGTSGGYGPTQCDEEAIRRQWQEQFLKETDPCYNACQTGFDAESCVCGPTVLKPGCQDACSPVILDLNGDGVALTSPAGGVRFDLSGTGKLEQLAWTRADGDDVWLVLDRNGNNAVDHGQELFGNFSEQPPSAEPNGYSSLAVLDSPAAGGNANGRIDAADVHYAHLRLWNDRNHDGRSTPTELTTLRAAGITSIELEYRTSARHDQNGNYFRYRAKVESSSDAGKWSYDVFLKSAP